MCPLKIKKIKFITLEIMIESKSPSIPIPIVTTKIVRSNRLIPAAIIPLITKIFDSPSALTIY